MSQQKLDLAQSWETREDSKTQTWDQWCSGTKVDKLNVQVSLKSWGLTSLGCYSEHRRGR